MRRGVSNLISVIPRSAAVRHIWFFPSRRNDEVLAAIKTLRAETRADMKALDSRVSEAYNVWFRSNERIIYASMGIGFVAIGLHNYAMMAICEAQTESRTVKDILSGGMSGDTYAEYVRARLRGIEAEK